jgi:hypothetical protein
VSEFKVKCESLNKNLEEGQAKLKQSVGDFQGVYTVLVRDWFDDPPYGDIYTTTLRPVSIRYWIFEYAVGCALLE